MYQPIFEVTRGEVVESIHHGAVAVANGQGTLLAWHGDPQGTTFLRSSAKPLQALPFLESGAADHYGLNPEQIAVVCASHMGTDEHVRVVASIQEAAGLEESELLCGTHVPGDMATAKRLQDEGLEPTTNRHNCSGKHSAMLALAKFLGAPLESYLDLDHPVQQMILETLAEMCDLRPEEVYVGIDGCSAPNFAVPLSSAATAFARLADPSGLPPKRAQACRSIMAAMTSYPVMVSGVGRFDTVLMDVAQGQVVSKAGAEGYQAFGVIAGARGRNRPALGVAIKIADGNLGRRAGPPVALSVLEAMGLIGEVELTALSKFAPQQRTNFRGLIVGDERVSLHLQWSQDSIYAG